MTKEMEDRIEKAKKAKEVIEKIIEKFKRGELDHFTSKN